MLVYLNIGLHGILKNFEDVRKNFVHIQNIFIVNF